MNSKSDNVKGGISKLLPSSFDVIRLLTLHDALFFEEISEFCDIPNQQLAYIIRKLKDIKLVHTVPFLLDMRIAKYRLAKYSEMETVEKKVSPKLYHKITETINQGRIDQSNPMAYQTEGMQ